MKLELRHKIFIAFLLNSATIIVCILLIGRYYGERHFRRYLAGVEAERVLKLADALGQEYGRSGNWNAVLKDPGTWTSLRWFGPGMACPMPGDEMRGSPPGGGGALPPPPPAGEGGPMGGRPGFPPGRQGPPPGPFPGRPPFPQIALFDANKRPLVPQGDSSTPGSYRFTPVKVNERVVGWLGLKDFRQFERPTHPLDVEFLRQQSETFFAIGLAVLILAGLVTFVLTRHLLAPVRELERGTKALALRRFDTRIGVSSHDELGRLAAGFNAMAKALEKHQQTQQQWLVDISHELRTPLAVLRGEIEAMQDGIRSVTGQGLDSLHDEVLHLSRIVGDLRDLSMIEAGAFSCELAPVNPVEILTETIDRYRTRLGLRNIRVDLQEPVGGAVLVLADADRLKQLFSNLLENTLRYSDDPGVLKVSCGADGVQFFVSFEDSGPGVPEKSLPFLFDRLYRVDSARTRKNGGSGLGLSICKSIAESFGGRIEPSNSSLGGLKIGMSFPLHFESGA